MKSLKKLFNRVPRCSEESHRSQLCVLLVVRVILGDVTLASKVRRKFDSSKDSTVVQINKKGFAEPTEYYSHSYKLCLPEYAIVFSRKVQSDLRPSPSMTELDLLLRAQTAASNAAWYEALILTAAASLLPGKSVHEELSGYWREFVSAFERILAESLANNTLAPVLSPISDSRVAAYLRKMNFNTVSSERRHESWYVMRMLSNLGEDLKRSLVNANSETLRRVQFQAYQLKYHCMDEPIRNQDALEWWNFAFRKRFYVTMDEFFANSMLSAKEQTHLLPYLDATGDGVISRFDFDLFATWFSLFAQGASPDFSEAHSLASRRWFCAYAQREHAEVLLTSAPFVVRVSGRDPLSFALDMRRDGKVESTRILRDSKGLFHLQTRPNIKQPSLMQLLIRLEQAGVLSGVSGEPLRNSSGERVTNALLGDRLVPYRDSFVCSVSTLMRSASGLLRLLNEGLSPGSEGEQQSTGALLVHGLQALAKLTRENQMFSAELYSDEEFLLGISHSICFAFALPSVLKARPARGEALIALYECVNELSLCSFDQLASFFLEKLLAMWRTFATPREHAERQRLSCVAAILFLLSQCFAQGESLRERVSFLAFPSEADREAFLHNLDALALALAAFAEKPLLVLDMRQPDMLQIACERVLLVLRRIDAEILLSSTPRVLDSYQIALRTCLWEMETLDEVWEMFGEQQLDGSFWTSSFGAKLFAPLDVLRQLVFKYFQDAAECAEEAGSDAQTRLNRVWQKIVDLHQLFEDPQFSLHAFFLLSNWFGAFGSALSVAERRQKLERMEHLLCAPWFFGFTSRAQAVRVLQSQPSGTFLVRVSQTQRNSFAVDWMSDGQIQRMRLERSRHDAPFVVGGKQFDSIEDVLRAYAKELRTAPAVVEESAPQRSAIVMDEYVRHIMPKSEIAAPRKKGTQRRTPKSVLSGFVGGESVLSKRETYAATLQALRLEELALREPRGDSAALYAALAENLFGDAKLAEGIAANVARWLSKNPNYTVPDGRRISDCTREALGLPDGAAWNDQARIAASAELLGGSVALIAFSEFYSTRVVCFVQLADSTCAIVKFAGAVCQRKRRTFLAFAAKQNRVEFQTLLRKQRRLAASPSVQYSIARHGENGHVFAALESNDNDKVLACVLHFAEVNCTVLIERGEPEGFAGMTPVQYSITRSSLFALRLLLSQPFIDVEQSTPKNQSLLHLIAQHWRTPDVDEAVRLVQLRVEIDSQDNSGNTALHYALRNENLRLPLTSALLELNANTESANRRGERPLSVAIALKRLDLIQELVVHGASVPSDIDAGDDATNSYLRSAAKLWRKFDRLNLPRAIRHALLRTPDALGDHDHLMRIGIEDYETRKKLLETSRQGNVLASSMMIAIDSPVRQAWGELTESMDARSREFLEKSSERALLLLPSEIEYLPLIGHGATGRVYRGLLKSSGRSVAIKQYSANAKLAEDEFREHIRMEFRTLLKIESPFCVQLYGVIIESQSISLVMEYCSSGSLYQFMRSGRELNEALLTRFVKQMLLGIASFHQLETPISHHDIKPGNIFLTESLDIRIGDFGNAVFSEGGKTRPHATGLLGTPLYVAPEGLGEGESNKQGTTKADIYSFGLVVWELCMYLANKCKKHVLPYEEFGFDTRNLSMVVLAQKFVQGLVPTFPPNASPRYKELYTQCVQYEPEKRPTASQLLDQLG
jgi:hypothetical protein